MLYKSICYNYSLLCMHVTLLPYHVVSLPYHVIHLSFHVIHCVILCRINDIQNVMDAMEILVNYFDPPCKDVDETADGEVTIASM